MQKKARIIRLSEAAGSGRVVRFVSASIKHLAEGKEATWVTVTRTGSFTDPRYGRFEITPAMLAEMVANFDAGTYGQKIFLDVAHKPQDGAAAEIIRLAVEGDRLRALVQWTDFGREAVTKRGFAYLSAEYHENFIDNETGQPHGCVLQGAGLVTRPCIKRLDPVQLSEPDGEGKAATMLLHPKLLNDLKREVENTMNEHLKKLAEDLKAKGLSEAAITGILKQAEIALQGVADEAQQKALCEAFANSAKLLAEAGPSGTVQLSVGLTAEQVAAQFKQLREQEDAAQKKLAEDLQGRQKLLADTINEVGKGLPEETRKALAEDLAPAIVVGMSDTAVKALAEVQVKLAEKAEANKQLSGMGFQFAGNAHITVDSSNQVKALQEAVDKRLKLDRLSAPSRYQLSGGVVIEPGKALAEQVLAAFDAQQGHRLHQEHKMLAGGDGVMSDVAIPAVFERTVIREVLHQLVGLSLVDVGTGLFSQSVSIPYSYRDTTAAGMNDTRTYEGQGIKRAGVKQGMDIAYPLPQKLAFEVSDELRLLAGNGQIDFDVVAENARNAVRIIGEDTERLIWNEQVNASDEYGAAAVANEALTAQCNGTNNVFVLANFPVVKPRRVFDLQGNQIGSTVNPITITYDNVARTEYAPGGAAGIYWVMDHNLGELRLVTEAGAIVTPANGKTLVVNAYSYATNVVKWDTDLGGLKMKERYDDLLYRIGLRKSLLEDQRSYPASQMLMSGTLMNAIEQAEQFAANFARAGTSLDMDGNLGRVKGIPGFKSYAPGLQLADNRIIIGQRGLTRFRMLKPWSMGQLENQKDANGRFTGKKEAYGDQFIALHTPLPLKAGLTGVVLYSATGRVARAG